MKIKILLSSITLFALGMANAGSGGDIIEADPFSGAYIGLGAGFGTNIVQNSSLSSLLSIPGQFQWSLTRTGGDVSKGGFSGQVIGGYGQTFLHHYYLGGEIFYNYLNPAVHLTTTNTETVASSTSLTYAISETIKQTNSLGLAAHLGYDLGKVLPYGLIGAQYTPIHITANDSLSIPNSGGSYVNFNRTINQWGVLFGAGMQTELNEHFRVALEYEYVCQGAISTTRSDIFSGFNVVQFPIPGTLTVASSSSPNMSNIVARVMYAF